MKNDLSPAVYLLAFTILICMCGFSDSVTKRLDRIESLLVIAKAEVNHGNIK